MKNCLHYCFSQKEKIEIETKYQGQPFLEDMLSETTKSRIISFLVKHPTIYYEWRIGYEHTYFSPNGFTVYKKGLEKRIFSNATDIFDMLPVGEHSNSGDWNQWLKEAEIFKEYR